MFRGGVPKRKGLRKVTHQRVWFRTRGRVLQCPETDWSGASPLGNSEDDPKAAVDACSALTTVRPVAENMFRGGAQSSSRLQSLEALLKQRADMSKTQTSKKSSDDELLL